MSKPRGARGSVPLKNILQHFLSRIEDKQTASTDCYEQEFQDLKKFSETLKYPCTEGEKEINKKKNRYKDILPFDVTRVVLSCGSDYINANYIKGASGSPAYIASQGPLPNTVADFWRMVVQCQVQVIVMACNPHEAGKHKCENYWVEKEGETKTFGCVEIRLIKASNVCPDFLVRTMLITYTNENHFKESRTVCQFHYLAWPDHGVPTLVRPLLDMVRLVRDTQASETLPVLVHCSAGCGRTGTICAIDFVWGLLRLGKMCEDFNLYDLVREMRRQRVAMVQTKEQYMLVHQAVSELLKQQLSLIQSHHYENLDINGEPIYDTIPNHADEETQMDNSECRKQSNATPIYESIRSNDCKNSEKPVPSNFEKLSDPDNKKEFTWENGEEKQDGNKIEYEEYRRSTASRSTPPLPRSKWSSPVSSKQEKEVENMTEKNRIAASLKAIILPDESPDNSLIRRPKIAKLRALFERSSPNSDKKTPKSKASISRSHSLGPIRKPSVSEIIKPVDVVEKSKKSEPAVRSGGKLKVPKLLSAPRTVPQVKRSKSLILNKQSTPFLSLLKEATGDGVFGPSQDGPSTQPFPKESTYEIPGKKPVAQSESSPGHFESHGGFRPINQRRRSLDSITGEESPRITWPNVVQHIPQQSMKPKAAMSLRHQLQVLTNASHRTVTSLASGWSLGIRERRNSFRQAISKDIDQFGTEGRFVYVSEDTKDANFAAAGVLVDAQNPHSHHSHLTVRAQNGDILPPKNHASNQLRVNPKDGLLPAKTSEDGSERRHNKLTRSGNSPGERPRPTDSRQWRMSSQSMRLPSNNKFLYRLRSELETKTMSRHGPEQKFPFPEQKISSRGRETEVNCRGNQATVTGGELQTRDTLTRSANAGGSREEKRRVVPGSDREKHMSEGQVVDRLYKDGLSKGDRFEMPMEVDVTDGVRKTRQYHPRDSRDGRDVSALNQSTNRPKVDRGGSRTLPPRISGRVFPLRHYPSKSSSASSQSSDNLSDYVKVPPIHPVGQSEKRHLRRSQPRMAVSDGLHDERSSRGMTMEGSRESTVPYSKDIKQRMSSDEMLSSGAPSVSRGMVKKAIYGRRMYLVEREGSESSSSSGARELIDHLLTPTTEVSWATLTRSKSSSDALMELKSHHVPPEPRAPPRVRRRSSTATAPPASLGTTSARSLTPHNRHASSQLGQLRYTPKPGTMKNMGVDVDAVAASMLSASLTSPPQLLSDPPLTHTSSHNPLTSRKHHYL